MDRKRRYKKLKIKRKILQNPDINKLQCFKTKACTNEIYKESENYKIDRFMRDVKKYGMSSTADEGDCNLDVGLNENENKGKLKRDKQEGNKKQALPLKDKVSHKENVGHSHGKIIKREGLFQRGIISKNFHKGLMPASLRARLNEDLQKMIKLASGKNCNLSNNSEKCKKYPGVEDDIWNRISLLNSRQHDSIVDEDNDDNITPIKDIKFCEKPRNYENDEISNGSDHIQEKPQKVEAEVQVSCPEQAYSSTQDDLYLKFTHFVTRSLFNSGIDKEAAQFRTDSLKESLIEIYHSRLKENVHKESSGPELNSDDQSFQLEDAGTVEASHYLSPFKRGNTLVCPSTSRSEEGPVREKFQFANNSQLSDNLNIRKPNKLYTSGIEYLQAVYGHSNQETNNSPSSKFESSYTFSPIQNISDFSTRSFSNQTRSNLCSFTPNLESNHCSIDDNNYIDDWETSKQPECSQSWMVGDDELDNKDKFSDPLPLQYFPGRSKAKYCQSKKQYYQCSSNLSYVTKASNQPDVYKSPDFISLLPASHKLNSMNNFYGSHHDVTAPNDSSGDYLQVGQSVFSLPKHVPPRKSPEIRFIPRRMF